MPASVKEHHVPHNTGMDWIRLPKRMAIYHRDAFTCIWCRQKTLRSAHGHGLTIDHVHSSGGNNHFNLVTCCHICNSTRQQKTLLKWLMQVSERWGEAPEHISHRVLLALHAPLDLETGKALALARRPRSKIKEKAA